MDVENPIHFCAMCIKNIYQIHVIISVWETLGVILMKQILFQ